MPVACEFLSEVRNTALRKQRCHYVTVVCLMSRKRKEVVDSLEKGTREW